MAIFNIFKKDKNKQKSEEFLKQIIETQDAVKEISPEENNSVERRFTLIVESVFSTSEDAGIVALGKVHGTVKVGDEIFVLDPNGVMSKDLVAGLEKNPDGRVDEACDCEVGIQLSEIKEKSQIGIFSALTNIVPQKNVNVSVAVENPYLLALVREYPNFVKNTDFLNILTYQIAHAKYLVAVTIDGDLEVNEDGVVIMTSGTQIKFPNLTDINDANKHDFPVFTDWVALQNWKNLFKGSKTPKTMICEFPDCVTMLDNGNEGITINPFADFSMYLPKGFVQTITQLEGYKNEFGNS